MRRLVRGWLPRRNRLIVVVGVVFVATLLLLAVFPSVVSAQALQEGGLPGLSVPSFSFVQEAESNSDVALSLKILFLFTILALAPAIIMMTTAFTRVVIVLQFVKRAIATQDLPPNQIIMALALFLTFFIMAPTIAQMKEAAWDPYVDGRIDTMEAYENAMPPLRDFMFSQTREKDLALFVELSGLERPNNRTDIPTYVLVPSFMISEIATAFTMGVLIFLPFVVVDMIISSVLLSMGILTLPPVLISLPFKILIFVLVDGWNLIAFSIVQSFHLAGG